MEMNVHLFTYQHTRETDGEKIIIHIYEDNTTPKSTREPSCLRHHVGEIVIDINPDNTTSGQGHNCRSVIMEGQRFQGNVGNQCCSCRSNERDCSNESTETGKDSALKVVLNLPRDDRFDVGPETKYRVIPHALRKQLKILLDAKHMFSSDWRDFAEKIGLDKCIPVLKEVESPTEKILDVFENSGKTLASLQHIFYEIGRQDCASEVDKYIRTETRLKLPVEHGNQSYETHSENSTGYQRTAQDRSCRSSTQSTIESVNCENALSENTKCAGNWQLYPRNIP